MYFYFQDSIFHLNIFPSFIEEGGGGQTLWHGGYKIFPKTKRVKKIVLKMLLLQYLFHMRVTTLNNVQ